MAKDDGGEGEGDEVEDCADASELCEEVTDDGICSGPGAESFFEVVVGGNFSVGAEEGYEVSGGDEGGDGEGEAKDERGPVFGE